ncbi:MAG: LysM peptidoglycan-binding domain-containing protein, partial [Caldilineaceae bacterium]|nr:LysM peptidoglycan-binding domain-containing protein [Caldilineaceae bacterium]
ASLVLCPGCGRELHAARSRSWSWIGLVVVAVLFLLLVQQWRTVSPVLWPREQLALGWQWFTELSERLDPQITIETIPAESAQGMASQPASGSAASNGAVQPLGLTIFATPTENTADAFDNGQPPVNNLVQGVLPEANQALQLGEATATAAPATPTTAPTETASPTALPTATITAAPTVASVVLAPTQRPTPTRLRPTATATATEQATDATATATASTNEERTDEATLAERTDAATTGGTSILQPTATNTAIDTPTATAVPPTSTPTPAPVTYKIQAGDTPLEIAARYDIGVTELLAANGLTIDDARRLRVGQELIIPSQGQTAQPIATPTSQQTRAEGNPTATVAAPTATPASAIRVDAPQLRSPESGAFLSCGGDNALIWLPVSFMREEDRFLLHLGFLNGYNTDGSENVVWILEQQQPPNATIWRMDEGLCSLAPQNYGRQWRWYVEVVEPAGTGWQPVSLPSSIWMFSWN